MSFEVSIDLAGERSIFIVQKVFGKINRFGMPINMNSNHLCFEFVQISKMYYFRTNQNLNYETHFSITFNVAAGQLI